MNFVFQQFFIFKSVHWSLYCSCFWIGYHKYTKLGDTNWNFLFNWFQCTAEIWLSRYKLLFNWLILSYWKVEPWRHIRLDTWFDFFETVLSFYFDSNNSLTELCEANRLSFPPLILILFLVHKQCRCVTND